MAAFFRTKRTSDEMAAALVILARGPDGMDESVIELLPVDSGLAASEVRFELLALRVCAAYTAARFSWDKGERRNDSLRRYIEMALLVFHPEYEDLEAVGARLAERSERYTREYALADAQSLAPRIGAVFSEFCGCPKDALLSGAGAAVFSATLHAVVSLGKSSKIV